MWATRSLSSRVGLAALLLRGSTGSKLSARPHMIVHRGVYSPIFRQHHERSALTSLTSLRRQPAAADERSPIFGWEDPLTTAYLDLEAEIAVAKAAQATGGSHHNASETDKLAANLVTLMEKVAAVLQFVAVPPTAGAKAEMVTTTTAGEEAAHASAEAEVTALEADTDDVATRATRELAPTAGTTADFMRYLRQRARQMGWTNKVYPQPDYARNGAFSSAWAVLAYRWGDEVVAVADRADCTLDGPEWDVEMCSATYALTDPVWDVPASWVCCEAAYCNNFEQRKEIDISLPEWGARVDDVWESEYRKGPEVLWPLMLIADAKLDLRLSENNSGRWFRTYTSKVARNSFTHGVHMAADEEQP
ncbi:hypothetical protein JKP88DRAFT_253215 [Tribonema minus]|uniref:Uncharacterized protein n=1 Tax=Tribonema minus TaxID=303371 RepID=A0A836CMK2_9STRA|nr:hypothetical protein JKP88DRAFT_253215 [Tribonema minus]